MVPRPTLIPAFMGVALIAGAPMPSPAGPEAVVQRQLDAYNARDLEAFMATYAPDARVHFGLGPEAKVAGPAEMRKIYGERFSAPGLHCHILSRMTLGAKVIDREQVTGIPGVPVKDAVAIYLVQGERIQEAWILVP